MPVTFNLAGSLDTAQRGLGGHKGSDPVTLVESGVTFTLSHSGPGTFFESIGGRESDYGYILAGNQTTSVPQTFALTWNGGALMDQFLNPSMTGDFEIGEIGIVTKNGTVFNTAANVFAHAGQVSAIKFLLSGSFNFAQIETIRAEAVNCFAAGTAIATPDGPVAVEKLQPGMRISTADGGETTVKWLGEQPVDVRLSHPARVNPIRIRAGALSEAVPSRDLYVSQDHALYIDGLLINVGALVNGSSIYQVDKMPLDGFTYYHVETDAHELLLAEGCPVESFVDYAGRDGFVNGEEREGAAPIREMALPRISAARLVPDAIRARLMERGGDSALPLRRSA